MSMDATIEQKLQALNPSYFRLLNESHMHAGPATESHYKVVLVSDAFAGKRPVGRHQMVYQQLAEEMKGPVHALSLHLFTEEEWAKEQSVPDSPLCQGSH